MEHKKAILAKMMMENKKAIFRKDEERARQVRGQADSRGEGPAVGIGDD